MKFIFLYIALLISFISNAQDVKSKIYNSTCNIKVPVNTYNTEILNKVTGFLDLRGFTVEMISKDDYADESEFIDSLEEKQLYLSEVSSSRSSGFFKKKCEAKIQINELYAKNEENYEGRGFDLSNAVISKFLILEEKKKLKPLSSKELCNQALLEAIARLPFCFKS